MSIKIKIAPLVFLFLTSFTHSENFLEKLQKKADKAQQQTGITPNKPGQQKAISSPGMNLSSGEALPPLFTSPLFMSIPGAKRIPGAYTESFYSAVEMQDGTIFVAMKSALLATKNRGAEWTVLPGKYDAMNGFTALQDGKLFQSVGLKGILRSDDNGYTWKAMNSGLPDALFGQMASNSQGTLYVASSVGLHQSTDQGLTWQWLTSTDYKNVVYSMYVDVNDDLYADIHTLQAEGLYVKKGGIGPWQLVIGGDWRQISGNNGRVCAYGAPFSHKGGSLNILITDGGTKTTSWPNSTGTTRRCAVDVEGNVYNPGAYQAGSSRTILYFSRAAGRVTALSLAGETTSMLITRSNVMLRVDSKNEVTVTDLPKVAARSAEIKKLVEAAGFPTTREFSATDSWLTGVFDIHQFEGNVSTKFQVSPGGAWRRKDRDPAFLSIDGSKSLSVTDPAVAKSIALALPRDKMIPIPGKSKPVAIVMSAWDCPICKVLEVWLSTQGYAYFVVPLALVERNGPVAQSVWCSNDRLSAWKSAMNRKPIAPVKECADWDYLHGNFVLENPLSKLGKVYPEIYLADGTVINGFSPEKAAALKAKISQAGFFE